MKPALLIIAFFSCFVAAICMIYGKSNYADLAIGIAFIFLGLSFLTP